MIRSMIARALELIAAARKPRFSAFVRGKRAIETFLHRQGKRFDELTAEDFAKARADTLTASALSDLEIAYKLSTEEDARADAATARFEKGITLHARGEFDEAFQEIEGALAILGGLPAASYSVQVSECHYHLGLLHLRAGRGSMAIAALRRARAIDENAGNQPGVTICDLALSTCASQGLDLSASTEPDANEATVKHSVADALFPPPDAEFTEEPDSSSDIQESLRVLVWLASHTRSANNMFMEFLETLTGELGRTVTVERAVFEETESARVLLPEPTLGQHLAVAVVILERQGLDHPGFRKMLEVCIARVTEAPDFRLLVYLHDIKREELMEMSADDPVLSQLIETTQLVETPSFDGFRRTLVPFLRNIERLQQRTAWQQLSRRGSIFSGGIASILLCVAVFVSLLGLPAWCFGTPPLPIPPVWVTITVMFVGVAVFPCLLPSLFLLCHGFNGTRDALGILGPFYRHLFGSIVIVFSGGLLFSALGRPLPSLLPGLLAGVLLETLRRSAYRERRKQFDFAELRRAAIQPTSIQPDMRRDGLQFYKCPILPATTARVFISYTRQSPAACQIAAVIYRKLKNLGGDPFLDRASIPAGANWPSYLKAHLSECDAFVSILDESGAKRDWVAAELMAAQSAQRETGTPEVVILLDPALRKDKAGVIPIFQEAIANVDAPPRANHPLALVQSPEACDNLAWGFSPGRLTPLAVLNRLAALLMLLPQGVFAYLGGLAVLLGVFICFFEFSERYFGLAIMSRLGGFGLSQPSLWIAAYWLGITIRMTFAFRFEWEHAPRAGIFWLYVAITGLFFTCQRFGTSASPLALVWAFLFLIVGWMAMAATMHMGENQRRHFENEQLRHSKKIGRSN
jgi:hypothetical protein